MQGFFVSSGGRWRRKRAGWQRKWQQATAYEYGSAPVPRMTKPSRQVDPPELSRDPLAFLPGVADKLGYYVYALRDPRNGEIFYVGKGRRSRAYQHAKHALRVGSGESRAELKLGRIQKIHASGREVAVEIIRHGLPNEETAFEVEAAVIDVFRSGGTERANLVSGHGVERGWLPLEQIEAKYAAEPIVIRHKVLLIRLRNLPRDQDELYRRTRSWWKINRRRASRAELALGVYEGVVRSVYRIDHWERPTKRAVKRNPRLQGRLAFRGKRDLESERRYLFKDVRRDLPQDGGQNPIRYVNC